MQTSNSNTDLETMKAAVDPSHYKDYMPGYQWLEAMQHRYSPDCFEAAVDIQVRKYMDRSGKKDKVIQEGLKAIWYLKFKIAFMIAGRPIKISEVDALLSDGVSVGEAAPATSELRAVESPVMYKRSEEIEGYALYLTGRGEWRESASYRNHALSCQIRFRACANGMYERLQAATRKAISSNKQEES